MKITLSLLVFLILYCNSIVSAQIQCVYDPTIAYCNNPNFNTLQKRGMYVDYFLTLDVNERVRTDYSILGDPIKEDILLQYASDQSIDVLYLYDLGTIFDRLTQPYDLVNGNLTYGQLLNNFMNRAKTVFNIRQIGACVSSKNQSRLIYQWDGRPLWTCEGVAEPPVIHARLKKIDEYIVNEVGRDRYCPALELTKLMLQVFAFNELWNGEKLDFTRRLPFACHGTNARFDRIITEHEFWGAGVNSQAAKDANTADYYNTYVPILGLGACLRPYSGCPLFVDTYIGFLDWDNVNDQMQAWLIDWKCDRVGLHAYSCDPDRLFNFFNRYHGNDRRLELFSEATTKPNSELWPIFSAEKVSWHDVNAPNLKINLDNYLGPYLSDDTQLNYNATYGGYTWGCAENIFQAEAASNNLFDNIINGYLWFTYSCLHENPEQITFKLGRIEFNNIKFYSFQNSNQSVSIILEHSINLDLGLNVVDVLGKSIYNQKIINSEFSIDLPTGLYSLQLVSGKEVIKTEMISVVK